MSVDLILTQDGIQFANASQQSRATFPVPVRQTVISGPVDTNGFSAFGGSTGSTTVTAAGTIRLTASNGYDASGAVDYVGILTNPSWTGLSTNGTMYLYADAVTGAVGSGTLAPIYQWGGTPVTTSGQFTFNIQEMKGYLGNGSTAPQSNRVYLGEVTVAGSVVTVITWYALMGRHKVEQSTLTANTLFTFSHNIGTSDLKVRQYVYCKTAEKGYAIGDRTYDNQDGQNGIGSTWIGVLSSTSRTALFLTTGNFIGCINKTTGNLDAFTLANWGAGALVERAW